MIFSMNFFTIFLFMCAYFIHAFIKIMLIVACDNWNAMYPNLLSFSYVRYHRKLRGHEEETVMPKHTITPGQAGMSRRNRSSFVERKGEGREGGGVRREEQSGHSERRRRRKGRQREAAKFRFRSGELNSVNFAAEPNFPPTLSSRLSFPLYHSSLSRSLGDERYGERRATTPPQSLPLMRTRMAEPPILLRHNWTTSLSSTCCSFSSLSFLFSPIKVFSRTRYGKLYSGKSKQDIISL